MTHAQLLNFGLKIYFNSTFNEVHKQLEPLWKSFAKRKYEIQFTSRSVAKQLVHDQQVQLLIQRLETSRSVFSKQIALLSKQTSTQSSKALMERSKSLKDVITTLKDGNKIRSLHLQAVILIRQSYF